MPYSEYQILRMNDLCEIVEKNKEHEHAAPTYRDHIYLLKLEELLDTASDTEPETLEYKVAGHGYLGECYYSMCRPTIAAEHYKKAAAALAATAAQRELTKEENEMLDHSVYCAVKSRNYYVSDECEDIVLLVDGAMDRKRAEKLRSEAQEWRGGLPKNDPIEMTPEYLDVIDEIEAKIDQNKKMDWCIEYWNLKGDYLSERGIFWRSPVILNPGTMFD